MTDEQRLNWLNEDTERLEDVRGYMVNEEVDIREAIDRLAELQKS